MEMKRNQAVKNISVAILMVIIGVVLLLFKSILTMGSGVVNYILGGILILIGIAMMGEPKKLPGFITLVVGIAVVLLGVFAGHLLGIVGWIVLIAGLILGVVSFISARKTY